MAIVNHPDPGHPWRDAEGNVDWNAAAQEAQDRLPLTLGEWNTDEYGRTLVGMSVCGVCDGGGCGDCIG